MTSMSMSFPVKAGTAAKVNSWYNNNPSSYGNFTIEDYRRALERVGVMKQTWSCQTTQGGGELFTVYWEAPDARVARDRFLQMITGVEQWCKDQLNAQGGQVTGPSDPSGQVNSWQILPRP